MTATFDTPHPSTSRDHILTDLIDMRVQRATAQSSDVMAGISHAMTGKKVQDNILHTMKYFHHNGDHPLDPNETIQSDSPFFEALRHYPDTPIQKNNHPDAFAVMSLMRTTMLRSSATENKALSHQLNSLQTLIDNLDFDRRLDAQFAEYNNRRDNLTPSEEQHYLLLSTLTTQARNSSA